MRNDLETREIADTELDAVAGGVSQAHVGADLGTTLGTSAVVAAGSEINAGLGISTTLGASATLGAGAATSLHTSI